MTELLDLINRIKVCDDAIQATGPHVLIKAIEELGEAAAELLKQESAHMRKNKVSVENYKEFLVDVLQSSMSDEQKIETIRDGFKPRTADLNELCRESADAVITMIVLPLYYGATPEQVVGALYEKLEKFEQRVASSQYQISQRSA